ncbi:MAG: hypothetical protein IJS79_01220 [Oscillospiraceae bacterium]|nr:hypothetical protein [Oscillospiraceae bacterium]
MPLKSRAFLFSLALLFVFTANLNLCCRVGVNGKWDDAAYSLGDARRAELVAAAAAEEILPRRARMPEIEHCLFLSLRAPRGEIRHLSDRILSEVPGVSRLYAVHAGGRSFGVAADRDKLEERLRAALYSSMPGSAVRASFSEAIEIVPVYGRSGSALPCADIAQAVSGAVPALFLDREGNRISA